MICLIELTYYVKQLKQVNRNWMVQHSAAYVDGVFRPFWFTCAWIAGLEWVHGSCWTNPSLDDIDDPLAEGSQGGLASADRA